MTGRLFIRTHDNMPMPDRAMIDGTPIPVDDGFSFRLSLIENTVAEFELVRRQSGWQLLSGLSHRCAAIAWSPTGFVADAQMLAVGRLAEIPGDLFSSRQTLRYLCAPLDVESRMLAYARENLDVSPQVDWLIADASPSDPEAYLAGRSRVYRVDPVSHEISTYDEIVGDRIVDLSDLALADETRISDKPGVYDAPVRTLRARVRVDWTQAASGEVDIGSRFQRILSLDPSLGANIGGHVVFRNGEGWNALGGEAKTRRAGLHPVDVGSRYRIERSWRSPRNFTVEDVEGRRRTINDTAISTVDGGGGSASAASPIVTSVSPVFASYRHDVVAFPMAFDYAQPRSETLYAALECPLPIWLEVDLEDVREEPDFEFSLADVMSDPSIPDYEIQVEYKAGDLVRRADRYYECLEGHLSEEFGQIRPGFENDMKNRSYWERVFPDIPTPASLTRFFDSERGELLRRHVMLRLRKEALRRLRMRHVVLTYRWQDAAHVRLQDAVRFLIPWGDGTLRTVTGKIYSIEQTWDGLSQPLIQIEVAVSFGLSDFISRPDDTLDEPHAVLREPDSGLSVPIAAHQLVSPNYAVEHVRVVNDVGDQLAGIDAVLVEDKRLEDLSVELPTTIEVTMRSIQSTGTFEREFDLASAIENTPRGLQL